MTSHLNTVEWMLCMVIFAYNLSLLVLYLLFILMYIPNFSSCDDVKIPSGFVYCVCVGVSALHCLNLCLVTCVCVEVLRYTVNSSACRGFSALHCLNLCLATCVCVEVLRYTVNSSACLLLVLCCSLLCFLCSSVFA